MRNSFKTIYLAAAAILVIGTYLLAQGNRQPSERASAPRVLAMQQAQTESQTNPSGSSLSKAGWIGVMLEDVKGGNVRVKDVFPGGPAAFAGVRAGDVLVKIGGANVDSKDKAEAAVERLVPRRQAPLTVRRHGKTVELKITPDSLADFRERYVKEMVRRDPRDPKYGQFHGVSEADMSVEVIRRLFEQHQRMETALNDVTRELQALRKEVHALQK